MKETNSTGKMDLTPKEIVKSLDVYIIGQNNAKKSL